MTSSNSSGAEPDDGFDLVGELASIAANAIGDRPKLVRSTSAGELGRLFGWDDLNAALETHRFDWPRLRLVAAGEPVSIDEYTREVTRRTGSSYRAIDPGRLQAVLFEGATLVIDGVDQLHGELGVLASEIEKKLRAHVFINLYASWGVEGGFNLHWDDHEVVVLHLAGKKAWEVFPPTRRWPLWLDVADASRPSDDDPHEAFDLAAGDVLYVPHGWWHRAKPTDSPSLHLTIGIPRPTGVEFLSWLTDQMRDVESFREPLPLDGDAVEGGRRVAELLKHLGAMNPGPAMYEQFLNDIESAARPRPAFNLPGTRGGGVVEDRTEVSWSAPRAVIAVKQDEVTISVGGRVVAVALGAAPILNYLREQRSVPFGVMFERFPDVGAVRLSKLINELATLGLVRLRSV